MTCETITFLLGCRHVSPLKAWPLENVFPTKIAALSACPSHEMTAVTYNSFWSKKIKKESCSLILVSIIFKCDKNLSNSCRYSLNWCDLNWFSLFWYHGWFPRSVGSAKTCPETRLSKYEKSVQENIFTASSHIVIITVWSYWINYTKSQLFANI